MDKSFFKHFPWIGWVLIISVLSFLPGDQLPKVEFELISIDTLVHFCMYSGLAVLMLYPYQNKKLNLFRFRVYLVIVIVGITFGFLVELIQGNFIHLRYFGWSDIVANSIGTIFGAFLYGWIGRKIV